MHIALESAAQPEVHALIQELDAYQVPLYPAASHHGVDIAVLSKSNVIFAVVRDNDGSAVGCGAMVLESTYGELKRMFIKPTHRGKGVAKRLLQFLEQEAQIRECGKFVLETGYLQRDAIALYARCGYVVSGPFGVYTEDPHSVFMTKIVR
ncbi:GNAT family N-acetyltransferase [Cupriavidus pauculus]|uniref:GNAT family N-acetyltransferase n=1 Tax=Cupriavidus pauculus TaxID=82633 RepID=A0A2N5CDN0_9BURK|nr:GNAT family N-acetyltransferase [Cupriavidus pauculus]PLQ00350.1 GNAT family N-acetyltransferase [Cupriavidus pauculus]